MESSQRLISTPPPQSSPLNTTLRARKRSKTSSAAGDSLAINRGLRKCSSESSSECKAHYSKNKMRMLSKNVKMSGKHSKTRRASKPKLGSLQNAVVLAPFYTLKKSFQNKLINFCSLEKLKKMSYKTKMAKKRNMSFEYDIIELKPQTLSIKKEGKTSSKTNQKSKLTGYCRCKKNKEKTDRKQCGSIAKLKRKTSGKELLGFDVSGQLQSKRKKPNAEIFSPMALKTEFGHRQSFFIPNGQSLASELCPSPSVLSFQSEHDSWETFSNSPSFKEEYLEGTLAISSSSFDYLEGFDKNEWDFRDLGIRCSNKPGKSINNPKLLRADFLEKPFKGPSKHLIFERKSSDGQILDFMDREPQSQVISSEESHQHLLPLQMQSRTKTKKQESESGCAGPPESQSSNGGRVSRDLGRASSQTERPELKSLSEDNKNKVSQVEIGVQVEGNALEEGLFTNLNKNSQELSAIDACDEKVNILREKTPEEPYSGSSSSLSLPKPESSFKKSLPLNVETNSTENNPSETEFQLPTETEENSSQNSPN